MNTSIPSSQHLLDLPFDCETTVAYVIHRLRSNAMHTSRSFELASACGSLSTGICAHDPKSPCKCQLVILQVSHFDFEPVSIVFHAYDDKTEIFLVGGEKVTGQEGKERITQALDLREFGQCEQRLWRSESEDWRSQAS